MPNLRRLLALITLLPLAAAGFPPVPPHEIFGTVRDALGAPLSGPALVLFEGPTGVSQQAPITVWDEPGVNFRLSIPMDAGLTGEPFRPTALQPAAPFRLRVRIGKTTYLPIEMTGDLAALGESGQRTRLDLTLGVDADGNGLPDAWEQAVARFLGLAWTPGSIRPGDLYGNTGLSFRDVYLAGTYAMNPKEGFALQIRTQGNSPPTLGFTAVKGRQYTIQAAASIGAWQTTSFRVITASGVGTPIAAYHATETRRIEVQAPELPDATARFFRLVVQ